VILEVVSRTARIGAVVVTVPVCLVAPTEPAEDGTEAEAGAASAGADARVTAVAEAAVLALAAADEVVIAVLADGAGVTIVKAAAATEALFRAVRALERPAATAAQVAIGGLTRGALVLALRWIGGSGFAVCCGLKALLEVCTIGGELFIELITVIAQALAAATETGVSGELVTLCSEIAAAFDVVGIELALLSQRFGRACHRGGATRRRRRCRRAAREQQQSSQRGESHEFSPIRTGAAALVLRDYRDSL
jgi:hypothetical protein